MPRQARFVLSGQLHHVTQRGNYRQNIFNDDEDRVCYLTLINRYAQEYHNEIYAFCLMNNHVHFIIKPKEQYSLAGIFCRAHQQYSLYLHKKKDIQGHLWQERFYSCLLQGSHIHKAIKYVERNPVRAGIVIQPWNYHWSSAKAHLGTQYNIINLSDIKKHVNVSNWKDFLSDNEDEHDIKAIQEATRKGSVFGTPDYIKNLEEKYQIRLLSKPPGRPKKINV